MSELGPQNLRFTINDLSGMRRRLERSHYARFTLPPLPTGHAQVVMINYVDWWPLRRYFSVTPETVDGVSCCSECRKRIEKIKCQADERNLDPLVNLAFDILSNCPNCGQGNLPVEQSASFRAVEAEPARVRISPEQQENRVKVVSAERPAQAIATVTPAAAPAAESAPAIKVRKNNIKISSGTSTFSEAPATATNVYGAPSIRYRLASGAVVEVTITRRTCEEIVQHCRESKRTKREVGGIIVGYASETKGSDVTTSFQVTATDIVRIPSLDSSIAHYAINETQWAEIGQRIETTFTPQGKSRLGWFHTHPNQGVFFSPQDRDVHTIFTLPYQFAIVVDPRNMLAGLFAWADHANRLLTESNYFPLQLESETARRHNGPDNPGAPPPNSPPVSIWRVGLFAFLLTAALIYIAVNASLPIQPNYAIALSFTVFFGLRLFNARFFNPERLVEKELWDRVGERLSNPEPSTAEGRNIGLLITATLLIVVVGVILLVVGFFVGALTFKLPPSQVAATNSPTARNSLTSVEPAPRSVNLNVKEGDILEVSAKGLTVQYTRTNNNAEPWKAEKNQEEQFFSNVLKCDLTNKNKREELQRAWMKDDSQAATSILIRNAFISRLEREKHMKGEKWTVQFPIPCSDSKPSD
jgi:proteasome lid subunit RPN8/RPN11